MADLLGIIFIRELTRGIGHFTRYYFFKWIGKKRTFKSLSNYSKDEYKDLGKALAQDFWNAVVGTIVLIFLSILIVGIIYS